MKRIVFVDDEPKVLEGLQRMLRSRRHQWHMVFVTSGAAALQALAENAFDVIVTDVRMPEMDGVQLLQHVQQRFPGVIRIVLSGYFEREAALEAAGVAHQYLAKPCDPGKLCEAIDRLCHSTGILKDEDARRVVSAIGSLPSLPGTCASLVAALQRPDVGLEEIGRIIQQDVSMTAKVLQLVNSRLFGLVCEITTVQTAVGRLGLDTLRQLVLSVEIFRTFEPESPIHGFALEEFQDHCRLTAKIAARLPAPDAVVPVAVMAALLHDIGKLVLAVRLPGQFEKAIQAARLAGKPLYCMEEDSVGANHAEIGAYLLSLWGLPEAIIDAVSRHHRPETGSVPGGGLDVLAVTHIADALAWEVAAAGDDVDGMAPWNRDYLAALGVADRIDEWRIMARRIAQSQGF
ncbi:MAG: two-component system response regulator [Terriglobia bacterium]|nr:MAG: two-component system response regulator [Terriglobia bacterium]